MTVDLFDDLRPNYASACFPPARPFQDTAHEALRQGARGGHRCQMVMARAGASTGFAGLRGVHRNPLRGRQANVWDNPRNLIELSAKVSDAVDSTARGLVIATWRVPSADDG